MVLIGLGFRRLSMAPSSIGPVKAMIRSLDLPPLREFLHSLGEFPARSLRGRLRDFAHDHGIAV
jgi:phosphotransferase system enzyme I (PtsP)